MKQLLLLSAIFISTLSQVNAQELETKWIQEFDSKMNISDVPLVEGDYVYLVLKKGGKDYEIGDIFLQKRKISDNTLVKEVELITEGELTELSDFYEVNSEIYFITKTFYKKNNKTKLTIYKLDKDNVSFNEYKILAEEPSTKGENLFMAVSINFIDNKEYLSIMTGKHKEDDYFNTYEPHYFILSENGIEDVDYKSYSSCETKNSCSKSEGQGVSNTNYIDENTPKMKYQNEEYYFGNELGNKLNEDTYNAYSFASNQNLDKVYLLNYDIKNSTDCNFETILEGLNSITNTKIYKEFNFTPDNNDYMSMFKQNSNIYILSIKYNTTKGHSTLSNESISDPVFTSYSDIEIAKIDKDKKFCWKKSIDCEAHDIGENEIYYQLKFKNNLVLFYYNKYILIDIESGENKTIANNDFSLDKKYKLKWLPDYKNSIVYTDGNNNQKKIGIIQFKD